MGEKCLLSAPAKDWEASSAISALASAHVSTSLVGSRCLLGVNLSLSGICRCVEQVWPSLGSSASWWRPDHAACCTLSPNLSAAAASLSVTCKVLGLSGGRGTAGVLQWPWPKMVPLLHPLPSSHIFLKCLRALRGSRWPEKGREDVLVPQPSPFQRILAERTGLYACSWLLQPKG